MSGKRVRLARLFNPRSAKAVIIPVDHGIVLGSLPGLTDPLELLARLSRLSVDAVLLGFGLTKLALGCFERRDAPARVLTVDFPLFDTTPGGMQEVSGNQLLHPVTQALRYDADCLKIALVWGLEREKQAQNIKLVARTAEQCDRWGVPLMVEPVLWGAGIPLERKNDPELIEHASRIALELGADLLKISYTGDKESFSDLVRRLAVPVLVLGGPKMSTLREALAVASESVSSGARGVVFGRNVWQHPRMESVVAALQDIVHQGAGVDTAIARHELG